MPIDKKPQAEPIPGYRLLAPLGRGGFGEVWKCEAPGGLFKAIKFVEGPLDLLDADAPADEEWLAIQHVKDVRHPFLLSLDRVERVGSELVVVMELADHSLADRRGEYLRRGLPGIPRGELLGYLLEAAEALDVMNFRHGLQHLDVKPHNLFLVGNHVKVADFGLVARLGHDLLLPTAFTPIYAAPETFGGTLSRHCDQYSLAIVYQELLTGTVPFSGRSSRQLVLQHTQGEPDLSAVPIGDRPALARALTKEPSQRHPSCTAFVRALADSSRCEPIASEEPAPCPPQGRLEVSRLPATPTPQGCRIETHGGTTRLAKFIHEVASNSPRGTIAVGDALRQTGLMPSPVTDWLDADLGVRGRRNFRVRHLVPLPEEVVRQKANTCRQRWNGLLTWNEPGLFAFTVNSVGGFWRRWLGRAGGLAVALRLTPRINGTETVVEVKPFGCRRSEGAKLLDSVAPLLLDSLAAALQAMPERRRQDRVAWRSPFGVRFVRENDELSDVIECHGKDISLTGVGFYLPSGLSASRVILTLGAGGPEPALEVPANVVRVERGNGSWDEAGAQFLLDARGCG